MTSRKEIERQMRQEERLANLGITCEDSERLRRISMTLGRWSERECNGEVEVDEDGTAYGTNAAYSTGRITRWKVPNRERGALNRLAAIMAKYPELGAYHQTDPRGAALYIYRKADIPEGSSIDSVYSSFGVAVY